MSRYSPTVGRRTFDSRTPSLSDTVICRKSGTLNTINENSLSVVLAGIIVLVCQNVSTNGLVMDLYAVHLQCIVTWSPAAKIFLVVCTGACEFADHRQDCQSFFFSFFWSFFR